MDFTEYRQRGKEMVDYIADYLENIRDRRVYPDVKPGYMKNLLPDSAPLEGEQWDSIFGDVERVIMPGITHWQSPHMHAYFPALNSFPSLLGDMLADAINCIGFTWASSPACTELEIVVMNWLGKMINLPDDFLHLSNASRGGGVIQTTASEATLVCLLAGRTKAIQRFHEKRPGYQDAEINARLVAYCSDQAHSSVEKAALIGLVRMRYIEADENLSMRGQPLREAIEDDIRQGLVPFWVCATLGTTGSCSFDNLDEIGVVCREFNLWLHVDAAYAGSAFICPEFRTWLKGIERADSIAFNPSKWLMIHFDATALWVKDSTAVHRTFNVEPLYLQHENSGVAVDFMHWQIPLSRRFRALKIWFVLRSYGIKGLQKHIREGVRLAQKFEALVSADHRFEIPAKRHLGLVVFRIKGDNEITERLLKRLNHRGNLHCIPSSLKGKYVIRFTVTSTRTTVDDILKDWMEIKNAATSILDEMNITISNRVYLKDTKEKCEAFGSSLLLSNSPLSPKIVNGSFAALFDADEFLAKTYAGIRIAHQESPSMRRRVRGILMSGKQFSLDSHMDVVVQTSMDSSTTNSKVVDSYGKTTSSVKNKERDSIREDEESLEDCEMKWQLKTAPQLRNKLTENYLPVLNKPKPPKPPLPIDIIHPQNSLFTKYDANLTRSVNSVKTPLTQYQLFKNPRQLSAIRENRYDNIEQTEQANTISSIYPGKRYLYSEITLNNGYPFTDTIYCLPSPTEEIIPIIITPETPTSGPATSINVKETEESNKAVLKIPTTASLIFNKPEDTKKAKPKIRTTSSLILNKIDVPNKTIKKTSATTSLNLIRNTEIDESNKTIKNIPVTTSLNLQKSDDFSIPTEKIPSTTSLILNKKDDFSKPVPQPRIKTNLVFKETDDLRNISETPSSTNLLNLKDMDDLTKTRSQPLLETPTTSINVNETANLDKIKPNQLKNKTDDLSNITTETPSTTNPLYLKDMDDLTKTLLQPLLETPTTSINVNETVNLAKIIHNQLKSKSNDETPSSSEDESSGSLSQPSSDFEGSSTQASSLESV